MVIAKDCETEYLAFVREVDTTYFMEKRGGDKERIKVTKEEVLANAPDFAKSVEKIEHMSVAYRNGERMFIKQEALEENEHESNTIRPKETPVGNLDDRADGKITMTQARNLFYGDSTTQKTILKPKF